MRRPKTAEHSSARAAGNGLSLPGSTYGARVIDPTPPATAMEA